MHDMIDWTTVGTERRPRRGRAPRSARADKLWFLGGAALVLVLSMVGAVTAKTGDTLREGERNGTATRETQIIGKLRGETYVTRQSNTQTGSNAGGAAIYGCRRPTRECTRNVNLSTGPATAFVTTGKVPFTISAGATDVVANLNADRVDGKSASEIVTDAQAGTAANVAGRRPMSAMAFSSPTASNADEGTARATATEIPLDQFGPFSLYAKCFVDTDGGGPGVPAVFAETYLRTTQSGALFDGQIGTALDGDPAYLDIGTPEVDRRVETESAAGNAAAFEGEDDDSTVVAPDGTATPFHVILAAKGTAIPGGDGLYGAGQRCGFASSRNA